LNLNHILYLNHSLEFFLKGKKTDQALLKIMSYIKNHLVMQESRNFLEPDYKI